MSLRCSWFINQLSIHSSYVFFIDGFLIYFFSLCMFFFYYLVTSMLMALLLSILSLYSLFSDSSSCAFSRSLFYSCCLDDPACFSFSSPSFLFFIFSSHFFIYCYHAPPSFFVLKPSSPSAAIPCPGSSSSTCLIFPLLCSVSAKSPALL